MYVCLCRGITDRQIKDEVTLNGVCSMQELTERLGVGDNCGECRKQAKQILKQSQIQTRLPE